MLVPSRTTVVPSPAARAKVRTEKAEVCADGRPCSLCRTGAEPTLPLRKRRQGQRWYPLSPANRPKRDPLKSRVRRRRAIRPLTTRHHPRWSQGRQRLRATKELRRHPGRRLGPGRTGTKGTAPNCSHPSSEIREQTAPDRSR